MEKETYKDGDFYKEAYGNVMVGYLEENLENLQPVRLEDEKIRTLVASGYDCRRGTSVSWPVLYHLSHLRANLTEWLPIRETDRVLEMGVDGWFYKESKNGRLPGGKYKPKPYIGTKVCGCAQSGGLCRRSMDCFRYLYGRAESFRLDHSTGDFGGGGKIFFLSAFGSVSNYKTKKLSGAWRSFGACRG